MLKKLAILALGASLTLATMSAISWGGSSAKEPIKAEDFKLRQGHPVSSPSVPAGKAAKKPRVAYYETNNFSISANGGDDSFMKCPRRYKAINGYFGTDGGIFADYLASGRSVRRWDFGLQDTTGLPGQAFTGIVCVKGLRG